MLPRQVTSSRAVPVLEQKQRRSAVHLHLAEVAPRLADRAISSELTIGADLAFVNPIEWTAARTSG